MGLDTIADILGGRMETRFLGHPSITANTNINAPNSNIGSAAWLDDSLGYSLPSEPAGELTTTFGPDHPALTAPARIIGLESSNTPTSRAWTMVMDRLWVSGFFGNAGGTINGPDMPARSNNGDGYRLWVNGIGASTQVTTPITVTYTNSDGVPGRTATSYVVPVTTGSNWTHPLPLQSGDVGVKSVQSVSFTDTTSPTIGCRVIIQRKVTREPYNHRDNLAQQTRGRFLFTVTPIQPAGTVLVPTFLGGGITPNPFFIAMTLAYGT